MQHSIADLLQSRDLKVDVIGSVGRGSKLTTLGGVNELLERAVILTLI